MRGNSDVDTPMLGTRSDPTEANERIVVTMNRPSNVTAPAQTKICYTKERNVWRASTEGFEEAFEAVRRSDIVRALVGEISGFSQ